MFLVCGEALMDVFTIDKTATGMRLDARVGGSPFNVATGLARLAQPVAMLTALSRDFLGERLLRALADEGVNTQAVHRVDAPTTLSLIGMYSAGVPSYSFYGTGGADRQLPASAFDRLPDGIRAIHLGSYASVVAPIASTLRQLVEREHARCLISFDPNVRLNVEPDVARWQAVLRDMLPYTHLLKISEEDLALLQPGTRPEDFARMALGRGVKLVVLTRGSEGAVGWTPRAQAIVPGVAVEIVDTVGAGDSFQAALLTWLAEHDALGAPSLAALPQAQLRSALFFAASAAAITCSRRGADLPRRRELA